jgi:hypothetical protein
VDIITQSTSKETSLSLTHPKSNLSVEVATMQLQIRTVAGLLSFLLIDGTQGHAITISNHTQASTGFEPVSQSKSLCKFFPDLFHSVTHSSQPTYLMPFTSHPHPSIQLSSKALGPKTPKGARTASSLQAPLQKFPRLSSLLTQPATVPATGT